MFVNKCFVCGTVLTEENSSDEHILLNALGGHIHSKKLLCKRCNSVLGTTSDEELATELRFFASYLDVPRQRGNNQTVKTLDKKYDMMPGGIPVLRSPLVKKTELEKGFVFEAEVRDESELKRIVENLAKKYPGIDVEKVIQSKVEKIDAIEHLKIPAEFNGPKIFPSIIKSVVEYFLLCEGENHYIEHLVPYIKGEEDSCDCCMFYYPQTPYFDTVIGNLDHVLYVKGNAKEHILYGYVSYFGVIQCVILLSDCYDGKDIEEGYTYQVMTCEWRKSLPQYDLSKEQIEKIIKTPFSINYCRIQDAVRYYIMNADLIRLQRSIMPEFQEFYNEQCSKEQKGEIDSCEARSAIVAKYYNLISPWLLKYMNRPPQEQS